MTVTSIALFTRSGRGASRAGLGSATLMGLAPVLAYGPAASRSRPRSRLSGPEAGRTAERSVVAIRAGHRSTLLRTRYIHIT